MLAPGRISIVMPCFNAEAYVAEAVESVLGQSYRDIEIIVVDDESEDRTLQILERYGDRIATLRQRHRGPFPARNRGLAAASGEFVAFLDADDYWDRRCLERLHASLIAHDADLAYCGWQNVGSPPGGTAPYVPPDYMAADPGREFLVACPWPIHAALTRRVLVNAVGGFSERRFSAMDYDLWLRLLGKTRKMVRVPEVLAFYRWHARGQVSSTRWRQVLDSREARRSFASRHAEFLSALTKRQVRALVNDPVRAAARDALWRGDLRSAQKLFRAALFLGAIHPADGKYLFASLLPEKVFPGIVGAARHFSRRQAADAKERRLGP